MYEAAFPILILVVMFVVLCIPFMSEQRRSGPVGAMIAVSGSGDLLLISAIILVSGSAALKSAREEITHESRRGLSQLGDVMNTLGLIYFILYGTFRVMFVLLDSMAQSSSIQFAFCIVTVILMFFALTCTNWAVTQIGLAKLLYKLERASSYAYYH